MIHSYGDVSITFVHAVAGRVIREANFLTLLPNTHIGAFECCTFKFVSEMEVVRRSLVSDE